MTRGTVLIPCHNRRETTLACLGRLHANGDLATHRVIIIDDGSTDGTAAAVAARFPAVEILPGSGTLFWTGAIRLGMEFAAQENPQPLFWLNDDCHPRPNALAALTDWLLAHPNAIVGPRCLDARSGQAVPTGFVGRRTFAAEPGSTRAVDGLSGFCVGLGAQVGPALGAPDDARFPHYAGDTAYTLRAHHAGHPVVLLGAAEVELLDYARDGQRVGGGIDPDKSFAANWREVFVATRSPHRLATLRALLGLKYGPLLGAGLATWRTSRWAAEFVAAWVRARAQR